MPSCSSQPYFLPTMYYDFISHCLRYPFNLYAYYCFISPSRLQTLGMRVDFILVSPDCHHSLAASSPCLAVCPAAGMAFLLHAVIPGCRFPWVHHVIDFLVHIHKQHWAEPSETMIKKAGAWLSLCTLSLNSPETMRHLWNDCFRFIL